MVCLLCALNVNRIANKYCTWAVGQETSQQMNIRLLGVMFSNQFVAVVKKILYNVHGHPCKTNRKISSFGGRPDPRITVGSQTIERHRTNFWWMSTAIVVDDGLHYYLWWFTLLPLISPIIRDNQHQTIIKQHPFLQPHINLKLRALRTHQISYYNAVELETWFGVPPFGYMIVFQL